MQQLQSMQDIFKDKLLHIPDYQRGYAWEESQWEDLIQDIELMENGQEHYVGTLVLSRINGENGSKTILDDEGVTYEQYDIVDGQQRLTTLSILLQVLQVQMKKTNSKKKKFAQGIYKQYLATKKEGQILPKISLNRDTNEFYRKNIIIERKSPVGASILSEQRLLGAKSYFEQYFLNQKKELKDGYYTWLEQLYMKISSKMKFTVYLVPEATDVGIIFEVMNNRGKPLTEMEKVKNYLLYLVSKLVCSGGAELGEQINRVWTYIFENLMLAHAQGRDENQLLRNHWLMSMDYNPKKWDGCNSIKAKFSLKLYKGRHEQLRDEIRQYIETLKECCIAYCDILNPNRENAFANILEDKEMRNKIIQMSNKILRIGVLSSFIPILLAVRLRTANDACVYLEYLRLCEKFAFRVYRMENKRVNTGQTTLFMYGYELYHKKSSLWETYQGMRSLMLYYAPNIRFAELVEERGNWYDWHGIKYLLYEYELYCAARNPVAMDWSYLQKSDKKNSIEHILPQKPKRVSESEQSYWTKHWNTAQIEETIHDLGNLVLTFDNSTYSNKEFPRKKGEPGQQGCYANSGLFAERELALYEDWDYAAYENRRQKLEEWMLTRWKVDEEENTGISKSALQKMQEEAIPEGIQGNQKEDAESVYESLFLDTEYDTEY